jgi:hypothetical protein
VVGEFKFNKVIMNPATHARNMISNLGLNYFEGLNPITGMRHYAEATKELRRLKKFGVKGTRYYKEAQEQGLGLSTFAAAEIKELLDPAALGHLGKAGKKISKVRHKMANLYEKEEEFAKLAQYIFQRRSGKTAEQAWAVAERATFNYAHVTPFIRTLRESLFGYPFVTFTYKVTPQVARTAVVAPTKISNIGKIKRGIENLAAQQQYSFKDRKIIQTEEGELERERAVEPPWVRDGFYVKLPIKDKLGRSAYFDLTYIIPFGDMVSGEFLTRAVDQQTGLKEGPAGAVTKKLPFLNLIMELKSNQDFFGNKIFKDSDPVEKQLADIGRHLFKTMAPPLIADQVPGGFRPYGEGAGERRPGAVARSIGLERDLRQGIEGSGKQTRTILQEFARNIGLKTLPIEAELQENYAEWQEQRALKTILKEAGEISTFEIPFTPKNKK